MAKNLVQCSEDFSLSLDYAKFVTIMVSYKQYFVYIISSRRKVLYIGVTNNLVRRVFQYKNHLIEGFTKKYNIDQLVYFEDTNNVHAAIDREKQIKGLLRIKKIALIKTFNPEWKDLSADWDFMDRF